jgi:hypothetical protein
MRISPTDLLRQLGAGVRPDGATASHARPAVDASSFGEMLDRVRHGGVASERPMVVSGAVAEKVTLTDAQLSRVATATDAAEAAGATRMIAVVGGQALLVDVHTRTIEGAASAATARLMTGVDAVVLVPDDPAADMTELFAGGSGFGGGGSGSASTDVLAGLGGTGNRSVAALLASLAGTGTDELSRDSAA